MKSNYYLTKHWKRITKVGVNYIIGKNNGIMGALIYDQTTHLETIAIMFSFQFHHIKRVLRFACSLNFYGKVGFSRVDPEKE